MNRNFIYLINPISGTKNKAALLQLIEEKTKKQGIPFQVLPTNAQGDYDFLKHKITQENISDVIICGGDGTINQVAAALLKISVNIGIIPMGSGNGLALAAGIPRNPGKALKIIFFGRAVYVDAFTINSRFSCMLCGLGFDAQVAHDFAVHTSRGLSAYTKISLKNFLKAKPYSFVLNINGYNIHTEAFFISIANSNQFGNNFTIAPKASLSDGLLDIVIVNKMNKIKLIYALLKQIRIGKVQSPETASVTKQGIRYYQLSALEIGNPALAPLHIDGEPAETSTQFKIQIIKKAFLLLQPY